MNTATATYRNVLDVSPILQIVRNTETSKVNVFATADHFVDTNIRHVVNRRMKWTDFAETFVRTAVQRLAAELSGDAATRSQTILSNIETVIDLVRDAANRRKAWNSVEQFILLATERLIRSCS